MAKQKFSLLLPAYGLFCSCSIAPKWKGLLFFPVSKQIDFLIMVPVRDSPDSTGLRDFSEESLMGATESKKRREERGRKGKGRENEEKKEERGGGE